MSRGAIALFSYLGSKRLAYCSTGSSSKILLPVWTRRLRPQRP